MRKAYYDFIIEKSLVDKLSATELSFSRKLNILKSLLKNYNVSIINMALNSYYADYIRLNRHDDKKVKNILIGICHNINIKINHKGKL